MCTLALGPLAPTAAAQSVSLFSGTTAVGQQSSPLTVSVAIATSGVAVAPVAVDQGTTVAEFALAAGGSCVAGGVTAGTSCTVNLIFQPLSPGLRTGAVELLDGNGVLLGEALVAGNATGSLPAFDAGELTTVAGTGNWLYRGDGGPAIDSPIFLPTGVVADAAGNFFLSDSNNNRVRRVDGVTGIITTVAGDGNSGYSGDGGPATQAMISNPAALALDGAGNLYFVDSGNHAVRRVDAVTGIITSVAGTPGVQGYSGDGGPATAARLSFPEGLAFDAAGDFFIADTGNAVIRKVTAAGTISTVAGNGTAGYIGDGMQALASELNQPWNLAVAPDGSLYIADLSNNRVRKVAPTGIIATVAGNGTAGYGGDGGPASAAVLKAPAAVVLDPAGDLYIADSGNSLVRKIFAAGAEIVSVAGNGGQGYNGDNVPALTAQLYGPYGLSFASNGNLFIADLFNNRIRMVSATSLTLQYATIRVSKTSAPQAVPVDNDGNAALRVAAPVLNQSALDPATTTCNAGSSLATSVECNLGVEFAPTMVGSPTVGTLTFGSDSAAAPPVVTLSGTVLSVEPTTVSLNSSANPSLVGAAVTFTATVSAGDSFTGTVVFYDGTTQLCSVNLTGASANCTATALTLGSHNITANYSGDANNEQNTSPVLVQVVKQMPTVALTATPNPAQVGVTVTLTATVTAPTGTPSGVVSFLSNGTVIGSASLSTGVASFTTGSLSVGTDSLTAQYAGDTLNAAATSNTVPESVPQATTSISLGTSQASVPVGTGVTFSATVASLDPTGPMPTGTVQFFDGATSLGTAAVGGTGSAALPISTLAPGTHSITAVYSGDTDDAGSHSTALTETVSQLGTVTGLAADANPVQAGATLHLTATVALAPGTTADGPITGNVTFTDNGNSLAVIAVNGSGQAVLALGTLPPGQHTIVATYAGNTNYSGSASTTLVETVQQTGTNTALISSANPSVAGLSVTFTATVSTATGTATRTVTFYDGAVPIGVGTLNPQGIATFSTSALAVGTHSITAVYSGDSFYTTSTSATLQQQVQQGASTTVLSASPTPGTLGQAVVLTATVASPSPNAGGSVQFFDGNNPLGQLPLGPNGTVALSVSTLAFGTHTLTAVYSGDTNHAGGTSTAVSELIVEPATAVLASSLNPSTSGVAVMFSIQVSGSGGLVPTGTVLLRDGSTLLGTLSLNSTGGASLSISTLAVGSHNLTASYSGDGNYSTAVATLIQTVQSANTQITLTPSANPATYAQPVSLTAAIVSNGSIASGSVTFTSNGQGIGSAVLNPQGVATLTVSTLTPGNDSIVANYAGDGSASASSSTPLTLAVKQTTTVALASSASPAQTLTPITLTAAVSNAGVGTASGTVTFFDGVTQLGIAPLNGAGAAALTVPQLSAGSHSLTASYSGDTADFASTSPAISQSVTLRPTTTTVSASNPDPANPQLALLIGVVEYTGSTPATGTVTFTSGGLTLGSAAINGAGVATLSVTLNYGSNTIGASYSGDIDYASSSSAATPVSGGTPTQFTLTVAPLSMSMPSAQHGTVTVSLTSVSSFTDTMQMGCLGLPVDATCTFTPDTMSLAANATATMQLTIDTGSPLGAGAQARLHPPAASSKAPFYLAWLPAGLLLGLCVSRRRRRWLRSMPALLLGCVALLATLTASGCAGLQTQSTPPGTYTFKVTAAGQGTGATQSQNITLTVTQ